MGGLSSADLAASGGREPGGGEADHGAVAESAGAVIVNKEGLLGAWC